MRRALVALGLAVLAGVGLGWPALVRMTAVPPAPAPVWDLSQILGEEVGDFPPAQGPWELRLPADLGAHPGFRTEVWGLAGQLTDGTGRVHGFQLSLVRLALVAGGETQPPTPGAPQPAPQPARASAWAAGQVYRGQLTLASAGAGRARTALRLGRDALGIAGASPDPLRVWVKDWSVEVLGQGAADWGLRLRAGAPGAELALDLRPRASPIVGASLGLFSQVAGADGLRLFVVPDLEASGRLDLDGESLEVRGRAFLERAWGAIPATRGQLAVNRIGLRLADGRVLLCLDLRRRDGTGIPIPSCALISGSGPQPRIQGFRRREIDLAPTDYWRSPRTGARYPVAWSLAIPSADLRLELTPLIRDQELDPGTRQWSGEVLVAGRQGGTDLAGSGRIELSAPASAPASPPASTPDAPN